MEAATRQTPAAVEMVAAQMRAEARRVPGLLRHQFPFEMTDEIRR
jgi:hypothetical protein